MKQDQPELEAHLDALERFACDATSLEELEKAMAEFDAFAFLGLSSSEQIHSNVLAWLLNPSENHNLGNFFLKGFLLETGAVFSEEMDIWQSKILVEREWRNVVDGELGYLDILVVNHETQFICAIENKIFSGEHGGQLSHYRRALEQHFPEYRRSYLFLSPRGVAPVSAADRESWIPANYTTILRLVEEALDLASEPEDAAVTAFLRQYVTCLRRTVVPNGELRRKAAAIYQQHKEAIDLILRHKDAYVEDVRTFCKEAISLQHGWVLEDDREDLVGFAPAGWRKFNAFHTGNGWPQTDAVLLFHFDLRDFQTVSLILTISRGEQRDPVRRQLFDMAQRNGDRFNTRGHRLGGRYTDRFIRLHVSEPVLSRKDFANWDGAMARDRVVQWVASFADRHLPAMDEAIVECFRGMPYPEGSAGATEEQEETGMG